MMKLKYKFNIDNFNHLLVDNDINETKIDFDIKNDGSVHYINTFWERGEEFYIKINGSIWSYDKRSKEIVEKVYYNEVEFDKSCKNSIKKRLKREESILSAKKKEKEMQLKGQQNRLYQNDNDMNHFDNME